MKPVIAMLSMPLLIANGFPAANYELAARFAGALITGEMASAEQLLVADAVLSDWGGRSKTIEELAAYLQSCPLKSIEGNRDRNINVRLDCSGENRSASIEFEGERIRAVTFGPPPQLIVEPIGKAGG